MEKYVLLHAVLGPEQHMNKALVLNLIKVYETPKTQDHNTKLYQYAPTHTCTVLSFNSCTLKHLAMA